MAGNFLEQLTGEWYEFNGYFVRRNVLVGKRAKGGYDCELDVIAFHPGKSHLVHIEPSMDADSWSDREKRFRLKFKMGKRHIPGLFQGLDLPDTIEQMALLGFASKKNHATIGGGKIVLVSELLVEIFTALEPLGMATNAIPEHMPILRSFQFASEYRSELVRIWGMTDKTSP